MIHVTTFGLPDTHAYESGTKNRRVHKRSEELLQEAALSFVRRSFRVFWSVSSTMRDYGVKIQQSVTKA